MEEIKVGDKLMMHMEIVEYEKKYQIEKDSIQRQNNLLKGQKNDNT